MPTASASSSAPSAAPTAPGSATTRGPRRSRPRPRTRCSGSAPTTSTSTAPRGWTPRCRSRRRSARSRELIEAGYVRCDRALGGRAPRRSAAPRRTHPIADLQIEYSLVSRGIEPAILPACRELGIAHHRLRHPLARSASAATSGRTARRSPATSAAALAALQRRERGAQRCRSSSACARSPQARGASVAAARDRLGAVARRGHRAADRRPPPRPAQRGARRARVTLSDDELERDRACGARGRGRRRRATPRRRWPSWTASARRSQRRSDGFDHFDDPRLGIEQRHRPASRLVDLNPRRRGRLVLVIGAGAVQPAVLDHDTSPAASTLRSKRLVASPRWPPRSQAMRLDKDPGRAGCP